MDACIDEQSDAGCTQGYDEERVVVTYVVVYQKSGCWGDARGEIVGQAVIAYAFSSSGRMEHIDSAGAVGHCNGPHGSTVQGAYYREQSHGARYEIASKKGEEEEVTGK